jgi:hypothetical protein
MSESRSDMDLLREVLENLHQPEKLNKHPWIKNRMVVEACNQQPGLSIQSPGRQLIQAICSEFLLMLPDRSPSRGLRLDTRWGEFGILAAQYFAPYLFDLPYPASLRDAWQGIDKAILLFVFNNQNNISEQDRNRYQLIGNEPEIAPNSTISDWHRKGLERFAAQIVQHERNLEFKTGIAKPISRWAGLKSFFHKINPPRLVWVWLGRLILILMMALIVMGAWRGWQLFQQAKSLMRQAEELSTLSTSLSDPDRFSEITPLVSQLRTDLASFQKDTNSLLSITPYLGWVPIYGNDLKQAPYLMEMLVQMSVAGDEVLRAVTPLFSSIKDNQLSDILNLIRQLKGADTQLIAAQVALVNIQAARQKIQPDQLSQVIKKIIVEKIDPILISLNDAFPVTDVLQMARLAPRIVGAVGNGPQTYMIMIQNEDELRPTGGFLSAVGLMKIEDGKVTNLTFESSDMVDDLSKSYPKAPWQLDQYMKSQILLFRDSNWFTNFPTTVEWAKYLYAYTRSKVIDGVIAVDQHVLVDLLKIVGPLNVPGVDIPISSENVLGYMRFAKVYDPPPGISWREWDRKQFIGRLSEPLVKKLLSVDNQTWLPLAHGLIQLLDEKHILLHFNDPEMSSLIAKRGWDGAVRVEPNSDYLMVVDSNVGFNKTNALMQSQYEYTVNLDDPLNPTGNLTVTLTNNSQDSSDANPACIQAGGDIRDLPLDQRKYILNDCYWTYLRVYSPAQSQLISSTPHEIPQKWPIREQIIPAHTDILEENIIGAHAFGMLMVVPIGQTLQTNYSYQLPAMVVSNRVGSNSTFNYRLKIQKQPGTQAIPFTFHLILAPGMSVINTSVGSQLVKQSQTEWIFNGKLNEDLVIEVNFIADK